MHTDTALPVETYIGVACYDAAGTWLGTFAHGQRIPASVRERAVETRVVGMLIDSTGD
jgi:hypothetical protein